MSRAVLRQDDGQPALFDLRAWEQEVLHVRDQERFSGRDTERDQRLVSAVLSAVSAGVPRQHICDLARISSHTVQGIVERAEKDGRIAPFKARISAALRRGAETIATSLIEDVEKGELPPSSKPVALGILLDKTLLLDGEATARLEVRHVDADGVWERIQRVRQSLEVPAMVPVSESESDGECGNAGVSCANGAAATAQATAAVAQGVELGPVEAAPIEATEARAEGGGGSGPRPGARKTFGFPKSATTQRTHERVCAPAFGAHRCLLAHVPVVRSAH